MLINESETDMFTRDLTLSNRHACVVTHANIIICWGWNRYGQADFNVSAEFAK